MHLRHLAHLIGLLAAAGSTCQPFPARAQHPNVRVSNPGSTSPEEVTIAVDPTNPLRLAAGANIRYFYYSFDGGLGWTEGVLSSSLGVAGDPVVLYDEHGYLYYGHLSISSTGDWLDRIVVQRSSTGGMAWNDGAGVGLDPPRDQDKPGLAVDRTGSPYRDRLYLAWTEFDSYGSAQGQDSSRILFSHSVDLGITWSPPVRVNDVAGDCQDGDNTVEGAVPAVGPQGQVYLAWSGPGGILFDRSLDGGASWGRDVPVAAQPGGWDFAVSGISRCNGLPTTLCDSGNSPYRGFIYVVWSDQRAGADNTDLFLSRSTDGGLTWGPPVRVNDDLTTRHQFFPAATLDPETGILYVVYYDRRATTGDDTEIYLARSADGGQTFHSIRVSDQPFTPDPQVFFGDYIGVAALGRRIHPIWMRLDAGALSVWTASLSDSAATVGTPAPASVTVSLGAFPNPLRTSTRLSYSLAASGAVSVRVLDVQGRLKAVLADEMQQAGAHVLEWDARAFSPGLYFCTLSAAGTTTRVKLIVIR